jgi:hypothetical protein
VSKESKERGLGRRFNAPKPDKKKADDALVRGVFVPDSNDLARLRPNLAGRKRRFS